MIDKIELALNEMAYIDTTSNTCTILCFLGTIEVRDINNTLLATLNTEEIYTLPIQTGVYTIKGISTSNIAYVFRLFVY